MTFNSAPLTSHGTTTVDASGAAATADQVQQQPPYGIQLPSDSAAAAACAHTTVDATHRAYSPSSPYST